MKWFHHFREMKSEKFSPFTLFEKWKWKSNDSKSRSRSESENQMTQNRDREVNFQKNSREFSRIETLAGHCCTPSIYSASPPSAHLWINRRSPGSPIHLLLDFQVSWEPKEHEVHFLPWALLSSSESHWISVTLNLLQKSSFSESSLLALTCWWRLTSHATWTLKLFCKGMGRKSGSV